MRRATRVIFTTWVIVALSCTWAIAKLAGVSGTKFVSRIAKKQELLVCMGQTVVMSESSFDKYLSSDVQQTAASDVDEIRKTLVLSDEKYVDRLERKLCAMVNDSIKDMDAMKFTPTRPVFTGNLLPESQFRLDDIKKKMDERRREK